MVKPSQRQNAYRENKREEKEQIILSQLFKGLFVDSHI